MNQRYRASLSGREAGNVAILVVVLELWQLCPSWSASTPTITPLHQRWFLNLIINEYALNGKYAVLYTSIFRYQLSRWIRIIETVNTE